MIIVEELDSLLNSEGWFLHKFEFINVNGNQYFRCRVRFPCRPYIDAAIINTEDATARYLINRIKGKVTNEDC